MDELFSRVQAALSSLPSNYVTWWLQLLKDSPVHVLVETTLIVSMIYVLVIKRSYDPTKR